MKTRAALETLKQFLKAVYNQQEETLPTTLPEHVERYELDWFDVEEIWDGKHFLGIPTRDESEVQICITKFVLRYLNSELVIKILELLPSHNYFLELLSEHPNYCDYKVMQRIQFWKTAHSSKTLPKEKYCLLPTMNLPKFVDKDRMVDFLQRHSALYFHKNLILMMILIPQFTNKNKHIVALIEHENWAQHAKDEVFLKKFLHAASLANVILPNVVFHVISENFCATKKQVLNWVSIYPPVLEYLDLETDRDVVLKTFESHYKLMKYESMRRQDFPNNRCIKMEGRSELLSLPHLLHPQAIVTLLEEFEEDVSFIRVLVHTLTGGTVLLPTNQIVEFLPDQMKLDPTIVLQDMLQSHTEYSTLAELIKLHPLAIESISELCIMQQDVLTAIAYCDKVIGTHSQDFLYKHEYVQKYCPTLSANWKPTKQQIFEEIVNNPAAIPYLGKEFYDKEFVIKAGTVYPKVLLNFCNFSSVKMADFFEMLRANGRLLPPILNQSWSQLVILLQDIIKDLFHHLYPNELDDNLQAKMLKEMILGALDNNITALDNQARVVYVEAHAVPLKEHLLIIFSKYFNVSNLSEVQLKIERVATTNENYMPQLKRKRT